MEELGYAYNAYRFIFQFEGSVAGSLRTTSSLSNYFWIYIKLYSLFIIHLPWPQLPLVIMLMIQSSK